MAFNLLTKRKLEVKHFIILTLNFIFLLFNLINFKYKHSINLNFNCNKMQFIQFD
jgi:hypothetical protein